MRKFAFIFLVLSVIGYLAGCGKKEQSLEQMQEPLSMEALSKVTTETDALTSSAPEARTQVMPSTEVAQQAEAPSSKTLEPLPPAGPYKPTNQEIQTALQNAGHYKGSVDGKIGPATRKAIEEFQKANNLKADGKVGPKTWAALSSHLNTPVETKAKAKAKKKR